jgi:hypothetical protein
MSHIKIDAVSLLAHKLKRFQHGTSPVKVGKTLPFTIPLDCMLRTLKKTGSRPQQWQRCRKMKTDVVSLLSYSSINSLHLTTQEVPIPPIRANSAANCAENSRQHTTSTSSHSAAMLHGIYENRKSALTLGMMPQIKIDPVSFLFHSSVRFLH